MPARKLTALQQRGMGKKQGAKKVLKEVNKFLRKHKVLSKGAKLVAPLSGKYEGKVRLAGKVAGMAGYGARRGSGLSPAGGGGLRLAGQRR